MTTVTDHETESSLQSCFECLAGYIYTIIDRQSGDDEDPLPDMEGIQHLTEERVNHYHTVLYERLIGLLLKNDRFIPMNQHPKVVSNGDRLICEVTPPMISVGLTCWMNELLDVKTGVENGKTRLVKTDIVITYSVLFDYKPHVVVRKKYFVV